ncbi:hypothetical protein E2C01_006841 [Portunus trituberculatus]|uniref:Uncharacterized protein n=1 Tax=Portunus trituberculatus TaxID=210409 RepID=A0A5B7CXV2_PORTR|nr:hypothetical protein [Portunus trituberculatus]
MEGCFSRRLLQEEDGGVRRQETSARINYRVFASCRSSKMGGSCVDKMVVPLKVNVQKEGQLAKGNKI